MVMMNSIYRFCALCDAHASIFCRSDEAFLCWSCDGTVHQNNPVAARHVRKIICSQCKGFTENSVSGGVCLPPQSLSLCAACSPVSAQNDRLGCLSSSSGSDCASSTLPCATRQRKKGCSEDNKSSQKRSPFSRTEERVLTNLYMKLGLTGHGAVLLGKCALSNCCSQMSGSHNRRKRLKSQPRGEEGYAESEGSS